MYDWLNNELVEVPFTISQKNSPIKVTIATMSSRNEHVITTTKILKLIRGAEPTIVSCTLFLPTNFVEVHVVVVSIQVNKIK
jgi:hypothetical protein